MIFKYFDPKLASSFAISCWISYIWILSYTYS